jgi:hypothetical protein
MRYTAFGDDVASTDEKVYKNISVRLDNLIRKYKTNKTEGLKLAQSKKMIKQEGVVGVIIYPENRKSSDVNVSLLDSYGIKYRVSRSFIYADIPLDYLEAVVKELKNVHYMNIPSKIVKEVITTQGLAAIGADKYQAKDYKGKGVKVAIIDVDYMDYDKAITAGELPSNLITKDFVSSTDNMAAGTDGHGAACAEIVYDLAPEAQMYLLKIGNPLSDLENAKDYCIANSINVISMSLGWISDNFCDGTGDVCGIVDQARDHGIFFAQAAGNHADVNWTGTYIDSGSWCQFSTNGTELIKVTSTGSGQSLTVDLMWDAFPFTRDIYDLYLYDQHLKQVDASIGLKNGYDAPVQSIDYTIPNDGTETNYYYIKVKKNSVPSGKNHKLRIIIGSSSTSNPSFVNSNDAVHSMSLLAPADSTGTFSVGAINYNNYTTGPQETFSSQGPTSDGRIKPDICAPDGVSTYSFGANSSFGTSFAAPHAAGAACILLSYKTAYKAVDVENELSLSAIDMGTAGKDNIYGYGRLMLTQVLPPNLESKALSTTSIEWYWSTGTYTNTGSVGYNIYDINGALKKSLNLGTSYWIETALSTNTLVTRNIKVYISSTPVSESDPATASRYTLTFAPYNLFVSSFGMHNINLAWTGEKNSTFRVDRSSNSQNWSIILSSKALYNASTYNDTGLLFSTSYFYRVYGCNGDGLYTKTFASVSGKTAGKPLGVLILISTATAVQEQKVTNPSVGDVKVDLPAGSLTQNSYIIINTDAGNNPVDVSKTSLDSATLKLTANKGKLIGGSVVRLNLYGVNGSSITSNFLNPVKLVMGYPDADNDGKVDNTPFHNEVDLLKIVNLNTSSLQWQEVSGALIDKTQKNISVDINHFSIYALAIVLSPSNDMNNVIVYPSPYKPANTSGYGDSPLGKGIIFEKLTQNAKIRIYNIAGELVKDVKESDVGSSGAYIWDTKNESGEYVASGVYIYYITSSLDTSIKTKGKFAIIK